jgi:anaerobic magnesium-protoporphyrin IX monomethyl ester cyclase
MTHENAYNYPKCAGLQPGEPGLNYFSHRSTMCERVSESVRLVRIAAAKPIVEEMMQLQKNDSSAPVLPPEKMQAKILLVRAYYRRQFRAAGFPVGIALIAAYLESKGVPVQILDLAEQKDWSEALKKEMDRSSPAIVGVSFQITQYPEALEVARFIKDNYPATKVILGGSYASSAPRDCVANPEVDVVCCAEGEITILQLLKAFENGEPLDTVDGIVFQREDGQIVQTPPRALIEDLDQMPMPAYHLLDLEPYINAEHTADFTGKKRRCMELITSRGCPYHCIYCHSFFGKKFRGRSPQHVMDEILYLHRKHRITEFVIWDDTFTMDIERTKKICDLIIDSGLKIVLQLRGGVRAEQMDEELMSKLKDAGTETMCVGIESAVWRIQKMIKKNLKIKKVEELLALAKRHRITTIGLMMMGFPGEKIEEIKENIRWAYRSQLDYTFFSIVTPFPSTELYELATREGYYAKNGDFDNMHVMIPHMETPEVKASRLKWLQIRGYLKFYSRPRRLVKLLSSAYIFKSFASSLRDYINIAASYYGRKLGNQPRIYTDSHG